MQNLEFLKTVSVVEFKAATGASKIDILKNDATGKCFFSYGSGKMGAVSSKYPEKALTEPVVSQVKAPDTGEVFLLLHNKHEGGAMVMASF